MKKNKYLRVPYGLSVHGKDEIKAVNSQIDKPLEQDVISEKSKKKMDFKFTGQVIDLSKFKK